MIHEEQKRELLQQVEYFIDTHPDCLIREVTGKKTIRTHGTTEPDITQTGQDVIVLASHEGILNVLAGHAKVVLKTEVFEH